MHLHVEYYKKSLLTKLQQVSQYLRSNWLHPFLSFMKKQHRFFVGLCRKYKKQTKQCFFTNKKALRLLFKTTSKERQTLLLLKPQESGALFFGFDGLIGFLGGCPHHLGSIFTLGGGFVKRLPDVHGIDIVMNFSHCVIGSVGKILRLLTPGSRFTEIVHLTPIQSDLVKITSIANELDPYVYDSVGSSMILLDPLYLIYVAVVIILLMLALIKELFWPTRHPTLPSTGGGGGGGNPSPPAGGGAAPVGGARAGALQGVNVPGGEGSGGLPAGSLWTIWSWSWALIMRMNTNPIVGHYLTIVREIVNFFRVIYNSLTQTLSLLNTSREWVTTAQSFFINMKRLAANLARLRTESRGLYDMYSGIVY